MTMKKKTITLEDGTVVDCGSNCRYKINDKEKGGE